LYRYTPAGLKEMANKVTPAQKMADEEMAILKNITEKKALMSAKELSNDTAYTTSMETGWKPPTHIRAMTLEECDDIRDKWHIIVEVGRCTLKCMPDLSSVYLG
jgi:ATP-dependent RNA helicase DDX41